METPTWWNLMTPQKNGGLTSTEHGESPTWSSYLWIVWLRPWGKQQNLRILGRNQRFAGENGRFPWDLLGGFMGLSQWFFAIHQLGRGRGDFSQCGAPAVRKAGFYTPWTMVLSIANHGEIGVISTNIQLSFEGPRIVRWFAGWIRMLDLCWNHGCRHSILNGRLRFSDNLEFPTTIIQRCGGFLKWGYP